MKLKNLFIYCAAAVIATACCCKTSVAPAIPQDKEIEAKIEKILKGMTLEEKVGQMTQITATALANGVELTPAGDSILRTYKIGSVLNTLADCAQTPEAFNNFIKEVNRISL
ncbi:MAG: beta-glucosidase, partial [Bacteroidales bacterium]|nr:beta-glucosidase [Bacteroidales bacterium]